MKILNFEELKTYLTSHNLHLGVHCTDIKNYQSIKNYGLAHDGRIDSTVNFYLTNLDNIKTLAHKRSNCVVIIAIPKEIFNSKF